MPNKQYQGSKKKARKKAYLERRRGKKYDKWAEKIREARTLEEMVDVLRIKGGNDGYS